MEQIVISGTGVFTPEESITNKELVESYNKYAEHYNQKNKKDIDLGKKAALDLSNEEFIFNASGIKNRYVMDKKGILDPEIMHPILDKRSDDQPSILAEMSVKAAKQALDKSGKTSNDIDAVITACSNLERAYPAISIEVQELLGIKGFAFDMNVACSSATFAIQAAADMIRSGSLVKLASSDKKFNGQVGRVVEMNVKFAHTNVGLVSVLLAPKGAAQGMWVAVPPDCLTCVT